MNWNEPVVWDYEHDRATIFGSQVPDTLVVECAGGELYAYIAIGDGLRPLPDSGQDTHEIAWSINDGSRVSDVWGRSEDGMTLYVPARAMTEILRAEEGPLIYTAKTMVRIDAAGGNEPPRPLEFDLPALDSLELSCVP